MKIHSLLAVGAAASIAGAASAEFIDFTGSVNQVDDFYVITVFANFSDENNVLLNVFDINISAEDEDGGVYAFNHSDFNTLQGGPGSFDPASSGNLTVPPVTSAIDSFVDIGYGTIGAGVNGTLLDPSFGNGLGGVIPADVGWYNGTPTTVISGFTHRLGQFVLNPDGNDVTFSIGGAVGYKLMPSHTDVVFGDGSYSVTVPAPGALALLGIGGLIARRRRA